MASDECGKQMLLIVGIDVSENLVVQTYDVSEDEWYPETVFPHLQFGDVVADDTKIYVVNQKMDFDSERYSNQMEIHSYDLVIKEMESRKFSLDEPFGKPIGVYKGYLYFVNTFGCPNFLNRYKLDERTLERNVANLIERYYQEGTALMDGTIYVVGAMYANYEKSDCEAYDIDKNCSESMAPYPVSVSNRRCPQWADMPPFLISATGYRGKLYTIEENSLSRMYVYCPQKNEWTIVKNQSPPAVSNGSLTTCGGQLICVDRKMLIHIYDYESNRWESRIDYNGVITTMYFVCAINKFD